MCLWKHSSQEWTWWYQDPRSGCSGRTRGAYPTQSWDLWSRHNRNTRGGAIVGCTTSSITNHYTWSDIYLIRYQKRVRIPRIKIKGHQRGTSMRMDKALKLFLSHNTLYGVSRMMKIWLLSSVMWQRIARISELYEYACSAHKGLIRRTGSLVTI